MYRRASHCLGLNHETVLSVLNNFYVASGQHVPTVFKSASQFFFTNACSHFSILLLSVSLYTVGSFVFLPIMLCTHKGIVIHIMDLACCGETDMSYEPNIKGTHS